MILSVQSYKNHELVLYHAGKHNMPLHQSEVIFEELKLFLVDCLTIDKNVPNEEIDAFWHSFILHTYDYQAFCHNYLGRFIHHYPHFDKAGTAEMLSESFECRCDSGSKNTPTAYSNEPFLF
ncbi:glycine-rich domain-containing protein [Chitinophaga arvensicola]|uniref:Uncharacterized protein n=1 Tax=Chitinophaga arvensicola TaxID=29529 RepID=A0A1I0RHX0_9BACT|nr:hypothetical protein [Chitinophaga arvensicola]SEW40481.1 hypothetical protein SAMN04488122_2860 [Chitinophaga arvensicola]